jgi:hypothetical protein
MRKNIAIGTIKHHGMQKHDEAAPDHAHRIDRVRQANLPDDTGILEELAAGFRRRARYEHPGDQLHREVGQKDREFLTKQLAVDHAKHDHENAHADGDPERSEDRAPVTLMNVVPREHRPQPPVRHPVNQVARAGG